MEPAANETLLKLKDIRPAQKSSEWYIETSPRSINSYMFYWDFYRKFTEQSPASLIGLQANHTSGFEAIWGKASFVFRNEYLWNGWVFPLSQDESLIVLSSKGGGTAFEISGGRDGSWPPSVSRSAEIKAVAIIEAINRELAAPIRASVKKSTISAEEGHSPT